MRNLLLIIGLILITACSSNLEDKKPVAIPQMSETIEAADSVQASDQKEASQSLRKKENKSKRIELLKPTLSPALSEEDDMPRLD